MKRNLASELVNSLVQLTSRITKLYLKAGDASNLELSLMEDVARMNHKIDKLLKGDSILNHVTVRTDVCECGSEWDEFGVCKQGCK